LPFSFSLLLLVDLPRYAFHYTLSTFEVQLEKRKRQSFAEKTAGRLCAGQR